MSLQAKKSTILTFIKARNPSGLRRLILAIEAKDGFVYDWDIHQDKKGDWFAFYRRQLSGAESEVKEIGGNE